MKHSAARMLLGSVFLVTAFAAHAQDAVKSPDPKTIPVLEKIKSQGQDLAYDYIGSNAGIEAWLISGDKVMQMVYVLPSGAAIVGGTLVSQDGKELSSVLQRDFAEKHRDRATAILDKVKASIGETGAALPADPVKPVMAGQEAAPTDHAAAKQAPMDMLWSKMQELGTVRFGATENAPIVYAVLDPVQAESKQAWKVLSEWAETNRIDLRIVPISLDKHEAALGSALVLSDADPVKTWRAWMAGTTPVQTKQAPANPDGVLRLKINADFVQALTLTTPSLLYRRDQTSPIRVVKGAPKNWDTVKGELGIDK